MPIQTTAASEKKIGCVLMVSTPPSPASETLCLEMPSLARNSFRDLSGVGRRAVRARSWCHDDPQERVCGAPLGGDDPDDVSAWRAEFRSGRTAVGRGRVRTRHAE